MKEKTMAGKVLESLGSPYLCYFAAAGPLDCGQTNSIGHDNLEVSTQDRVRSHSVPHADHHYGWIFSANKHI